MFLRIRLAWNILLGRPTMYRIDVVKGVVTMGRNGMAAYCRFEGSLPPAKASP